MGGRPPACPLTRGGTNMHKVPMWKKAAGLTAAAATLAMVGAGLAVADNVSNNLDGSIDAVAETMPLNVGGPNGTTQLFVVPQNGDGKSGCNLTGSTTLVIAISSGDTSVATVSPSSVTFTSCDDKPTLTVTAQSAGSTTISATQTSNTSAGSFNLAPVAFTVNVTAPAPANTAPQVSVSGVTAGATYDKGAVPAAMCEVTDAEDGNFSFLATLSAVTGTYASDGIGEQTANCSYTDAGDLTAADSVVYSIIDPSPPVINYTLTPSSPASSGWYISDVTLAWSVTEDESPNSLVKTGCADQNITVDQFSTDYSCSANSAGGSAGPVTVSIQRDATAPVVSVTGPGDGATYLLGAVPVAGCTTTDATSGVATEATVNVTGSGVGAQTATCTGGSDNAGNTTPAVSVTYNVVYNFTGFFAPVDNGGVLNTAKAGSAIPVKFSLSGDQGLSIMAAGSPSSRAINCDSQLATDAIEATVTAGSSSLSYDSTAGQYVYVWKTDKAWASSCRQVTVKLIDGTSHTANFKFTK